MARENIPVGRFYASYPSDCTYKLNSRVKTTSQHWDVVDEQGTVKTISEGFERMKLTYPCELDLLLKHIGLRIRHKWGDADRSPFNDPCNQEYHYLVEKDEPPG